MLRLQPSELALTPSDVRNFNPLHPDVRRRQYQQQQQQFRLERHASFKVHRGPRRHRTAALVSSPPTISSSPPPSPHPIHHSDHNSSAASPSSHSSSDDLKSYYCGSSPPLVGQGSVCSRPGTPFVFDSGLPTWLDCVEASYRHNPHPAVTETSGRVSSEGDVSSEREVTATLWSHQTSSAQPAIPQTLHPRRFRPRSYSDPLGHSVPQLNLPPPARHRRRSPFQRPHSAMATASDATCGHSTCRYTESDDPVSVTEYTLDGPADAPETAPAILHAMADQPSPLDALVQRVRALSVSMDNENITTLPVRSRALSDVSRTFSVNVPGASPPEPSSPEHTRTSRSSVQASRTSAPPNLIVTSAPLNGDPQVIDRANASHIFTDHGHSNDSNEHRVSRRPIPSSSSSNEMQDVEAAYEDRIRSRMQRLGSTLASTSSSEDALSQRMSQTSLLDSDLAEPHLPPPSVGSSSSQSDFASLHQWQPATDRAQQSNEDTMAHHQMHHIPRRPVPSRSVDPHLQPSASAANRGPEFAHQARMERASMQDQDADFAVRRGGRPRAETAYRAPVQIARAGAVRGPHPRRSSEQENLGSWDEDHGTFADVPARRFRARFRSVDHNDEGEDLTPPRA